MSKRLYCAPPIHEKDVPKIIEAVTAVRDLYRKSYHGLDKGPAKEKARMMIHGINSFLSKLEHEPQYWFEWDKLEKLYYPDKK